MKNTNDGQKNIEYNIAAHNKVASKYEKIHGEIYNTIEQQRLRASLTLALSYNESENEQMRVLDLGCGAGNLTSHLVTLGVSVVASDVSNEFLTRISRRFCEAKVTTLKLNGVDLSNVDDCSLDMVATYSVLHHIPDYLSMISECMRVLKPGGVLYIDHEVPDEYWDNVTELSDFYKIVGSVDLNLISKYFRPTNYIDFIIRKFINPRYRREGDIHVFPDDHIEWTKIKDKVEEHGEVMLIRDYLLYRSGYKIDVYSKFKDNLHDMRLGIYKRHI